MFDKLEAAELRYEEITEKINDPEVIADQEAWQKLMKEHASLTEVVEKYREYRKLNTTIKEAKELLEGKLEDDFREMVLAELEESKQKIEQVENELKVLLLPRDPNDEKNVIVEIRGGAGGEESALFAGEIFRMYTRYAERKRWKVEILNTNPTGIGGYKEVIFMIEGKGAYSRLKYESGVHRVQRVPETEANGRIHTSTITVAVLPEAEEVEVDINPNDVRVDVFRSSGNGGQSVNTTDSAVRLTHIPTGIVISMQDEKSQLKNKEKAFKVLRAKLYEIAQEEQNAKLAQERRSQVGTGDRSERIRTYNFPQGRVTDHRVGLTLYQMESVLDGEIDEFIDALITDDQAKKLQGTEE